MTRVIIVTGSARPTTISKKVLPHVQESLAKHKNIEVEIVDVASLQLPFFDAPVPPSNEEFAPTDEHVVAWTKKVGDADAVIMLTPEYNGNVTAIQKNAVDWIYKEWADKPVALIGYGWYDPSRSQTAWKVSFGTVLKAHLIEPFAQLQFMKDISVQGDVLDQTSIDAKLSATIEAFAAAITPVN